MAEPIGVFVIASYPSVRAGLRAMTEQAGTATVLADAPDAGIDSPLTPDLLLIDVELDSASVIERLSLRYPDAAQVLLLDDAESYTRLRHAIPAERATAVLLKDAGAGEIAAALAAVVQGLVVLDPEIARQQAPLANTYPRDDGLDTLTDREHQVLDLLALGLPNKTIAAELGISEHTVKFHVAAIMSKLGAASRTEAVAVAARRGLLVL